jgi:Activator of Hsp90 ATPase homolog 1-like protein
MTITFEDQGGKTLLTMIQTGFETEAVRDDFMSGWPAYLDTLGRVVAPRVGEIEDPGAGDVLKARHDT